MLQNTLGRAALLREGAMRLGLRLDDQQVKQFLIYLEELRRWSRQINLTSVTDESAIIERHFLDSLAGSAGLEPHEGLRLLDIGTGAGLPGLPLKLYYPTIHLTLVEPVQKKIAFLHHLCGLLKVQGVSILPERVEGLRRQRIHREAYGAVVARAFAPWEKTWDAAEPFVKPAGRILIYLTPEAIRGVKPRAGWRLRSLDYRLPITGRKRSIAVLERTNGFSP